MILAAFNQLSKAARSGAALRFAAAQQAPRGSRVREAMEFAVQDPVPNPISNRTVGRPCIEPGDADPLSPLHKLIVCLACQ